MSVTFDNTEFTGSDAGIGVVSVIPATPLTAASAAFVGSPLTSQIGATAVTVNGTVGAPGTTTASVSIDAKDALTGADLIEITNGASRYVGSYDLGDGHHAYYFIVAGTNAVTGSALTVGVAVSQEGVPNFLGLSGTPIDTSGAPAVPDAAPLLQSAVADGNTLTLAYDESLSAATAPNSAFTVDVDGRTVGVTGVSAAGRAVTLTLAAGVTAGQTVALTYQDPGPGDDANAVQSLVGTDAASFSIPSVTNVSPAASPGPVLQSATADGGTLTLGYDEALGTPGPLPTSFAVTADALPVVVTGAAVDGQNVVLTLAAPVAAGQAVTVSYLDPTPLNDPAAVQDAAGNDAATVIGRAVANTTPAATDPGGGGTTNPGGGGTANPGGGGTANPGGGGTTNPGGGDDATNPGGGGDATNPGGGATVTTSPSGSGTTVTTTDPLGATTTQLLPPGSTIAQGSGDLVSINPFASLAGHGQFIVGGHVAAGSGVTGVTISATVDGSDPVVLGTATVAADGSYSFLDHVGRHLQGFVSATETDGLGNTLTVQSPYSLQAGMHRGSFVAEQDVYTPSGDAQVADRRFRAGGSQVVDVMAGGQTFQSDFNDTFNNHAAPDNTFVFVPGHGQDVVNLFRVGGSDHDTLSFYGGDFNNDIAAVLQNTHSAKGGAVITDPATGDTVKLTGVSKKEIVANKGDFAFYG